MADPALGAHLVGLRIPLPRMPLALFGGSFNPPHLAHLAVAEACAEAAGLVPAEEPTEEDGVTHAIFRRPGDVR